VKRVDSREPAAAARNMVIDMGSILMPVCRASRPSTSCRYSGTTRKTSMRMRFWLNSPTRPERSGGIHSRLMWTSGSAPVFSRRRCHTVNAHSRTAPPAILQMVREKPSGVMGEFFGSTQPQVLDCSVPSTMRPRPAADMTPPR
jgi:hypothetical protein